MSEISLVPSAPAPILQNKGQRTASRILDAAEELFARRGYDATSLRDIATRAELQQPGLYKHFTGKEDLYRQVYKRALQPMTDLMDATLESSDGGFEELTDRITDLLSVHPNIARLLVRATISSDEKPDLVALDWLDKLVGYGQKFSAKAGLSLSDNLIAVQIVATFNMLFGFFWAAPLIEGATGKPPNDGAIIDLQKALLRNFVMSMGRGLSE